MIGSGVSSRARNLEARQEMRPTVRVTSDFGLREVTMAQLKTGAAVDGGQKEFDRGGPGG